MNKRKYSDIQKARKFYLSLPKKIHCPALKIDIQISRIAWDHLVTKNSRTAEQTYFRSKVIYHIKYILENSSFYQKHKIIKTNSFWVIQAVTSGICCELLIRKTGGQKHQLYSFVYKGKSPITQNS